MNIQKIEGIGPATANRLAEAGITTTEALLDSAASKAGRQQLVTATGLAEDLVLGWVNKADLMRVKGVGEEYSDLLESAGVDTVKELRRRNAANLHKALLETNEVKKLCRRAPSHSQVEQWVAHAKDLPAVITY